MDPQQPIRDINAAPTPTATPPDSLAGLYSSLPLPSSPPAVAVPPQPAAPPQPAQPPQAVTPPQPTTTLPPPPIPNQPLTATPIETPRPAVKNRMPWLRDIIGLGVFVVVIFVGAMLINSFIFRSFNVIGPSMEPTLEGGVDGQPNDRVIVNLIPVTLAHLGGNDWLPARGEIIVFKNPKWTAGHDDEYVVKRVVGLPGERVTINDCQLTIYNQERQDGFDPYPDFKNFADNDKELNTCIDGDGTDVVVPSDAVFVVGDHRVNNYSMDSRNGDGRATLGTIPLKDIVGPVSLRIWPINQLKVF
ncbi:signal peptidase I [Candidatus Saccharibacteria bacterium]|nr:signal peptidase I [Candidatus Saccharibacteria bacterium]